MRRVVRQRLDDILLQGASERGGQHLDICLCGRGIVLPVTGQRRSDGLAAVFHGRQPAQRALQPERIPKPDGVQSGERFEHLAAECIVLRRIGQRQIQLFRLLERIHVGPVLPHMQAAEYVGHVHSYAFVGRKLGGVASGRLQRLRAVAAGLGLLLNGKQNLSAPRFPLVDVQAEQRVGADGKEAGDGGQQLDVGIAVSGLPARHRLRRHAQKDGKLLLRDPCAGSAGL